MRCPHCGHLEDKVVDSRSAQDARAIRRRRECLACGQRFTTYEYVEQPGLIVVKSDQRREPFDRRKVLQGIKLACNKRPVTSKQMEAMAEQVEAEIQAMGGTETTSHQVGELVMKKLRDIDDIAYVRFASVYRKFADKQEFLEEMRKLLE